MFHIGFEIIKLEKWNWNLTMDISLTGPDLVHYFQLNWNSECWFLRREEIWRKTLRARMRAKNSTHKWLKGQESNPGHRGVILIVHYTCYILWIHILRQSTSFLGMQTEVAIYFCSRKQNLVKINTHHLERFWFGFFITKWITTNFFWQ